MNQKDYKAIAEIIKHHNIWGNDKKQHLPNLLILELADYFEKESKERDKDFAESQGLNIKEVGKSFNRSQFLRDCGVE